MSDVSTGASGGTGDAVWERVSLVSRAAGVLGWEKRLASLIWSLMVERRRVPEARL